jgi:hypothetical protein
LYTARVVIVLILLSKPLLPAYNPRYFAAFGYSHSPVLYPTLAVAATTCPVSIDLFAFYPPSSLLLCKLCGYSVPPTALNTHIRLYYLDDARNAATNP